MGNTSVIAKLCCLKPNSSFNENPQVWKPRFELTQSKVWQQSLLNSLGEHKASSYRLRNAVDAQILAEISKGGRLSLNIWILSATTSQGYMDFSPRSAGKRISVWFWFQSAVFGLFLRG